jgi:hypothetical protein
MTTTTTPRIKEPTKKTYHFPKSAKEPAEVKKAAAAKKPAVKASRTASAKKAAPVAATPAVAPEAASAPAKKAAPKQAKAAKTTKAAGTTKSKAAGAAKPAPTVKAAQTPKAAKPAKAPKQTKAATEAKTVKAKAAPAAEDRKPRAKKEKEKVVRDSFTMPKSDYAKIAELKQRCLDAGVPVKKSELLRAGLNLLAVSPAKRLIAAVQELETVKTGRPAKA